MAQYDAVFFDAGMTLIYAEPSMEEMCAIVASRYGVATDADSVRRALPEAHKYFLHRQREDPNIWSSDGRIVDFWKEFYSIVLGEVGLTEGAGECAKEIYDEFNEHTRWRLFPEVLDLLKELKRRDLVLGVVSDWGARLATHVLIPLGLSKYFDFMVVSATVGGAKPGNHIFETALKRASVSPSRAMHVGDNYVADVLGARAAGITPVLLDRDGLVEKVDCLKVSRLDEILQFL
ncbi:MAG: HAD-IA family hydrolase [Chloroflexi bacterium]|nr:HAD-IA family hydrolase [Chloroflexota bacterium]